FAAYQGLNERKGESRSNLNVPTAAERSGDFSQSSLKPRDPLSGLPCPRNEIPLNRFDPAIVKFMDALIPLPNSGSQYIYNAPITKDGSQFMGRVDMQLTSQQRLFGRVFYDTNDTVNTAGLPLLHAAVTFKTWKPGVNHTHTL